MVQDQEQPRDEGPGEPTPMSPEVRGMLRRRLLTGGAAALPVIMTYGRRSWAQSGFELSNCLSRTFNISAEDAFGATPHQDMLQFFNRDELITAVDTFTTGPFEFDGNTFIVDNLPAGEPGFNMDGLILSSGAGIRFEVEPVLDDGEPVQIAFDGEVVTLHHIKVVAPSSFAQGGCLASAGVGINPDDFFDDI